MVVDKVSMGQPGRPGSLDLEVSLVRLSLEPQLRQLPFYIPAQVHFRVQEHQIDRFVFILKQINCIVESRIGCFVFSTYCWIELKVTLYIEWKACSDISHLLDFHAHWILRGNRRLQLFLQQHTWFITEHALPISHAVRMINCRRICAEYAFCGRGNDAFFSRRMWVSPRPHCHFGFIQINLLSASWQSSCFYCIMVYSHSDY